MCDWPPLGAARSLVFVTIAWLASATATPAWPAQDGPEVAAAVAACCPGLRLPAAADVRAPWSAAERNYAIDGDFNGDGARDAAVLLVDAAAAAAPTLAVFHRQDGRYRLAHRLRLDKVDDLVIAAPQQIVIRLVKRGEAWAPESGDVPQAYPHAFDAIGVATHQSSPAGGVESRQHLIYWNGRAYAMY